jgi:hypothetical protein
MEAEALTMTYSFPLAEWAWRGTLSWWWVGLIIGLSAVAVVFVYFRESMKMHPARRITMAALRVLTIAAIVLLLKKPVIISEKEGEKPRPIAIVVDNTQSMGQKDPRTNELDRLRVGIARGVFPPDYGNKVKPDDYGKLPTDEPSRAQIVMSAFQNGQLNLRDRLREKGPLQEYLFGTQLRGAAKDWEKSVPATEAQTAILNSLSELLQRDENELPAAVVLVTDGIDNASQIPWEEVGREFAKRQIPIHVYGVGCGTTGILQIKNPETLLESRTLFVEDQVRVPFRWRAQGIKDGEIELNVTLGGRTVATKRVRAKEGEDLSETLSFVPEKRDAAGGGRLEMVASISVVGSREADKVTETVRVVESKVKVLYVENAPRWEFKFMMRAFLRDRRIEPTFIIVNGDDKTMKSGPPFLPAFPSERKDLFAYDMLIIGDVDANYFSLDQRKWIKDFVSEGGGLVMIAGRQHAPASYLNTPIGEILPVEFEAKSFPIDDARRPEEFIPKVSDVGRRDTAMTLADDSDENLKTWKGLPGWYWHYPVTKLKPAAVSLLDHPKEEIEVIRPGAKEGKVPMPLIARQYAGRGRVVFCASDETWRWRFNEGDKYFARLWGQIAYQVGLPHLLGGRSQIMPIGDFVKGKATKVYARLFTPDFRPLERDRVPLTVEYLDAKGDDPRTETVYLEPDPNQPGTGMYVTTITKNREGNYRLHLGDSSGDGSTQDFRVPLPPDDELSPGNINETKLRRLAEVTGGKKLYREEDLKDLVNDVVPKSVRLDPPPRIETLVWMRWWAFAIVIGLFTLEWLVRKFSNLS